MTHDPDVEFAFLNSGSSKRKRGSHVPNNTHYCLNSLCDWQPKHREPPMKGMIRILRTSALVGVLI
ncbi:MAG: hypothetical protein KFF68_15005, partial [Desulfosarcina sp.]|nr:hypothetical protein [Desulfosarcina sp.]